jgi:hypothetical protein
MKLQIWKIHVVEGVMGAIHGQSYAIYEAYVPELKLTVNHVTSFVNENDSRYLPKNDDEKEESLIETPDPELVCVVEMSRSQIEDAKALASEDSPFDRTCSLIASILKENDIDTEQYDDE